MSRDYTGVETTCGDINEVIQVLEGVIEALEKPLFDEDDKAGIIQRLKDLYIGDMRRGLRWPLLEELRKANADLRDFGNDTYKKLSESERELEQANKTISDLEWDVKALEGEVQKLELQIQ